MSGKIRQPHWIKTDRRNSNLFHKEDIFFPTKMIEPEMKQITNETKEEMKKNSQQKKQRLSTALIIKIPASNLYYNSVNIAVVRQSSGKIYSIIQ